MSEFVDGNRMSAYSENGLEPDGISQEAKGAARVDPLTATKEAGRKIIVRYAICFIAGNEGVIYILEQSQGRKELTSTVAHGSSGTCSVSAVLDVVRLAHSVIFCIRLLS